MDELLQISSHPLALALLIVLVSWVWEDAAVISAALLAVDHHISVPLALVAVFIGICSGDLALFYLGRWAHRWRRLRKWILTNPQSRQLSRKFRRRTISNIFIIRFVPGLRSLGFTLCGLWMISLRRFVVAITTAGVFWIAIIFSGVYRLGSSEWLENSHWKWGLVGIALLLLVVNNVWAYLSNKNKKVPV